MQVDQYMINCDLNNQYHTYTFSNSIPSKTNVATTLIRAKGVCTVRQIMTWVSITFIHICEDKISSRKT